MLGFECFNWLFGFRLVGSCLSTWKFLTVREVYELSVEILRVECFGNF